MTADLAVFLAVLFVLIAAGYCVTSHVLQAEIKAKGWPDRWYPFAWAFIGGMCLGWGYEFMTLVVKAQAL